MKRRHRYGPAIGSVMVLLTCGAAADESPTELRHNPFSRPPSERTVPARNADPGPGDVATAIELQATMVAGSDRLANVGGRILRPGDEVLGYLLRQVFEDRAIFSRDGKELTVYVKPERVKEDE